ncbi:MAG TPA: hypothetical protein VF221_20365, partial [Chloroflexota bacterium]
MKPATTAAPLQKQVISDLPAVTTRRYAVPYAYVVLAVLICLLGETALLYGRSIHLSFVSDDWPILQGSRDLHSVFAVGGGYHYNPIPRLVVFALYSAFGLQVVPYHIAGILLFFVGAALVACLALCLTGRIGIALLAGVIFVAYGSQYEAAIWGVVGFWHTTSTILYIAGLILYIVSHNPALTIARRRLTYLGFLIALILGPFAHEQTTSLIAACALYRLLVLEHDAGFQPSALARRAQAWVRDFAAPVALILVYLGFKAWMGSQTTTPQAPGLKASWDVLSFTACLGFFQAFVPGLGLHDLLRLSLDQRGPHYHVRVLIAQVLALSVISVFVKPVYRFLLAWTALLV